MFVGFCTEEVPVDAPANVHDQEVGEPVLRSVKLMQVPGQMLVFEAVKFAVGPAVVVLNVKSSTCVQSPNPPPVNCTVINCPLFGATKVNVRCTHEPCTGGGAV